MVSVAFISGHTVPFRSVMTTPTDAPPWWLAEAAHAGPEHLDPEYVVGYDRKAGTDPSDDVRLLRDLGLDETSTLVDLGAGTGTLAMAAAPHCRRVVAVDVSPAMLAALRARADRAGLDNVECVRAGFLTYEHRGEPADFVYSRNALHHLPDFWKAIALHRVAGMLRPGGVLRLRDLVYSFEPAEAEPAIEAWLACAVERPEDGWTCAELATHVREEHSTFAWLLEPMLERAGFAIREAAHSPSRTFAAYTCVRLDVM
jgi:SAM-dependent methyltransferase